jgi:hypothetical protein
MANTIKPAAREAGVIQDPQIGLLIMGRKRPGFDPAWGTAIRTRITETLKGMPYPLTIPSENITDERELRIAVESCTTAGATLLVVVQPTISDGRMAPPALPALGRPTPPLGDPREADRPHDQRQLPRRHPCHGCNSSTARPSS